MILAAGGTLTFDLPQPKTMATTAAGPVTPVVSEAERRQRERTNVLAALERSGSRVSGKGGAAELLGINPATLASRLKALGISKRGFRP